MVVQDSTKYKFLESTLEKQQQSNLWSGSKSALFQVNMFMLCQFATFSKTALLIFPFNSP